MMHCPMGTPWEHIVVVCFRSLLWIFWLWAAAVVLCLTYIKDFFGLKIQMLNWLIQWHGLDGGVTGTDRGLQQFHRDLWVLLLLLMAAIVLINLI